MYRNTRQNTSKQRMDTKVKSHVNKSSKGFRRQHETKVTTAKKQVNPLDVQTKSIGTICLYVVLVILGIGLLAGGVLVLHYFNAEPRKSFRILGLPETADKADLETAFKTLSNDLFVHFRASSRIVLLYLLLYSLISFFLGILKHILIARIVKRNWRKSKKPTIT